MTETIIPAGMTEREYFEIHATEKEFLDWYCKQDLPQYERPSVTVDMVAYCFVEGKIKLLLIRRKAHPYQNCLALVGGFMDKGEDAAHACQREVKEEINLELPLEKIEQLVTVSTPGRDPRGWTVTIAHLVYLPSRALDLAKAGDDAKEVVLVDVDFHTGKCYLDGKELVEKDFAFDHAAIIQESIRKIQEAIDYDPRFLYLLEDEFTVDDGLALVETLCPGKSCTSDRFLSKYGHSIEEVGFKRIPQKEVITIYRLN